MSQDFNFADPTPANASRPWTEVWVDALIRPSVETFERIVSDPNAGQARAYLWIFVSALIGYGFILFVQFGISSLLGLASPEERSLRLEPGSALLALVCGMPGFATMSVIAVIINAGITQLVASLLGGTGTYSKLVYAFAAYLAPLTLISCVISIIPLLGSCLGVPLSIYGLALNVMAVKAVNRFDWGKAIVSSVLIFVLLLMLVAIVTIVILALLGPAIGNVFSNIINDI